MMLLVQQLGTRFRGVAVAVSGTIVCGVFTVACGPLFFMTPLPALLDGNLVVSTLRTAVICDVVLGAAN
jgi:hypothetical protein